VVLAVWAVHLSTVQLSAYEVGRGDPSNVTRLPLRLTLVAHPVMMELKLETPAGRSAEILSTVAFDTPRPAVSSGLPDTTPGLYVRK